MRAAWRVLAGSDPAAAFAAAGTLLLLNGDMHTPWGRRRRYLGARPAAADVRRELAFSRVVLLRHPKADIAYSHRRWLLGQLVADLPGAGAAADLLAGEAAVAARVAANHPRCYHAWLHVTDSARLLARDAAAAAAHLQAFALPWLRADPLDASAWAHLVATARLFAADDAPSPAPPSGDADSDAGGAIARVLVAAAAVLADAATLRGGGGAGGEACEALWVHRRALAAVAAEIAGGGVAAAVAAELARIPPASGAEGGVFEARAAAFAAGDFSTPPMSRVRTAV